jgi:myo-inositol-1(or 4)-monophosphatase
MHAKDHADIVFNADTEAENAMIATLRAAFPEHAIVGKEAGEIVSQIVGQSRRRQERAPLDRRSARRRREFPPRLSELRRVRRADARQRGHARRHPRSVARRALRRDQGQKGRSSTARPSATSTCVRIEEALVGTVIPTPGSAKLAAYLPALNALASKCAGIRRAGTCALDLAYVAAGRLDGSGRWPQSRGTSRPARCSSSKPAAASATFAGGLEFMRTKDVIAAAPGVFSPLRDAIAAAVPAGSLILGAPVFGSSATAQSVTRRSRPSTRAAC